MKFYNRKKELKILSDTKKLAAKVGAQFVVISGRRRIGKSELIRQAVKNDKHLYFFVSKKRSSNLLKEFNQQFNLLRKDSAEYGDWDSFIKALFEYCTNHAVTLIFDEFQEFYNLEEPIYSIFQKHWDNFQHRKGLTIIVAGSVVSLIEKIFYSAKEPLYGRATRKIVLEEFNFAAVANILKNYKKKTGLKNLLEFYSVFGGNPFYYNQIEKEQLFQKNIYVAINRLILQNYGSLRNEGREILIKEFGSEHSTYFSILEAISKGFDTFSKIQNYTQIDSGFLLRSLKTLEFSFQLLKKKVPLFPNNRKISKYVIVNHFTYFWFRYVYANQSILGLNFSQIILKKIKKELNSIIGYTFEKYCTQEILKKSLSGNLPFEVKNIGSWWDKYGEIDLIIDAVKNQVIFIECKLSQGGINTKQINNLLKTADRIDAVKNKNKQYYFMVAETVDRSKRELLKKYGIGVMV